MIQYNLLFSLLFFITSAIEICCGLYILSINQKGMINKLFFAISISLFFWSFGFGMANMGKDLEEVLIWRRFSAIGWTTAYALLLHIIILLTRKDDKLGIKHYFLLYLPALVSIYIFAISDRFAPLQYNIVKIKYGWLNIPVNNLWDYLFYVYYLLYVISCIILIIHWKRNSKEKRIKKQANLMLTAILSILILGTFTDLILNSILGADLPQMAPIFNLIPVVGVLYAVHKNTYIRELMERKTDLILNNEDKSKLYLYLGLLFQLRCLLSFLPYFVPIMLEESTNIKSLIYIGIISYFIGIAILIFRMLKNEKVREILIIGMAILSIPITTLLSIKSTILTTWLFPLILMFIFLVFNTDIPLKLTLITSVMTQMIVLKYRPMELICISNYEIILRIGVLFITYGIGTTINKIYINRLKENNSYIELLKMISDVSFNFLIATKENIDFVINNLLKDIGLFLYAEKAYIFMIDDKQNYAYYAYEWCDVGITAKIGDCQDIPLDTLQAEMDILRRDGYIYVDKDSNNRNYLPKNLINNEEVNSLLIISVGECDNILGYIGLNFRYSSKHINQFTIGLLKSLSNMLASGLMKVQSEEDIEYMAFYDHLTGLPNRTLFKDRLVNAIQVSMRGGNFVSVMFMDLDNFKNINDTMGHSGGDQLLKDVSERLVSVLRKEDTVARFGGDEFLMLLNNVHNICNIDIVAEKIIQIFEKPFLINNKEINITGSLGVAVYPKDGQSIDTLIKNADIAMYEAKSKGKNQYALYKNFTR